MQERAETEREQVAEYSSLCTVCGGTPNPSGKVCICNDTGAAVIAQNNLLEENHRLRSERDRLVEAVEEIVDERFSRPHRPMRESRAIESARSELAGLEAVEGDGVEERYEYNSECICPTGNPTVPTQMERVATNEDCPVHGDAAPQDADAEEQLKKLDRETWVLIRKLAAHAHEAPGISDIPDVAFRWENALVRRIVDLARRLRRGGGEGDEGVDRLLQGTSEFSSNMPREDAIRQLRDRLRRSTPDGEGEGGVTMCECKEPLEPLELGNECCLRCGGQMPEHDHPIPNGEDDDS